MFHDSLPLNTEKCHKYRPDSGNLYSGGPTDLLCFKIGTS